MVQRLRFSINMQHLSHRFALMWGQRLKHRWERLPKHIDLLSWEAEVGCWNFVTDGRTNKAKPGVGFDKYHKRQYCQCVPRPKLWTETEGSHLLQTALDEIKHACRACPGQYQIYDKIQFKLYPKYWNWLYPIQLENVGPGSGGLKRGGQLGGSPNLAPNSILMVNIR